MNQFDIFSPQSVDEAIGMLARGGPDVVPIAGGTVLIVDMRNGRRSPQALVDISHLSEMRGIRRTDDEMVVGSGTLISTLAKDALIEEYGAPLRQAAAVFANTLIRNRATVGGNLAEASPGADTAPPLLALGASVDLTSVGGTRTVPLDGFFVGLRKTLRRPDELLTAVHWTIPPANSAGAFYKLGYLRKAATISILCMAVQVTLDDNGRCQTARIALGAVAPTPFRAHQAEAALLGKPLDHAAIAESARLAAAEASPRRSVRSGPEYRRRVIAVMVRRLLTEAALKLDRS